MEGGKWERDQGGEKIMIKIVNNNNNNNCCDGDKRRGGMGKNRKKIGKKIRIK